jgi:hypothetical protein
MTILRQCFIKKLLRDTIRGLEPRGDSSRSVPISCDRGGIERVCWTAGPAAGPTFFFQMCSNTYIRVYKIMGPLFIWGHGRRTRPHRPRSGHAKHGVCLVGARSQVKHLIINGSSLMVAGPSPSPTCATHTQRQPSCIPQQ